MASCCEVTRGKDQAPQKRAIAVDAENPRHAANPRRAAIIEESKTRIRLAKSMPGAFLHRRNALKDCNRCVYASFV
jgi:hypothetical protein